MKRQRINPRAWTRAQDDAVIEDYFDGKLAGDTAARLGRTKSAVRCRRIFIGLTDPDIRRELRMEWSRRRGKTA